MRRIVPALLLLALLAACAPQANLPQVQGGLVDAEARKQQEMAIRDYVAKMDQLDRVGWGVISKNADLCGENTTNRLGLNVLDVENFPKNQREIVKAVLGVGERTTIYQIVKGGPAEIAGVQRGDILLAVSGQVVQNKKHAWDCLGEVLKDGKPVTLAVERAGVRQEFTVAPVKVCAYSLYLKQNPTINAFADGKNITVMTGMMKFVKSDDELAAILGHELAHNTQGHLKSKMGNAVIGGVFDVLLAAITRTPNMNTFQNIGGSAFSQDFESEADYVGLYYTARAGYDIENVAEIWRRMAVENPGAITMGSSHPATSQRFVQLEAARDEIKRKAAEGQELRPEKK